MGWHHRPVDLCPACGFEQGEPPWQDGVGSQDICECCGLQFGYQDEGRVALPNRSVTSRAGCGRTAGVYPDVSIRRAALLRAPSPDRKAGSRCLK